MSDRRILLLVTDLEIGGTPTVVRELAIRLWAAEPGIEIQVACLGRWGPVADQLAAAGVRVTALGAKRSRDFRVLPKLIHLIRQERFDTVLSFLLHANSVAAAASLWVRGVRWIQSIQTAQPWPGWHWVVQRLAHRAAELIVVPSPSVAAVALNWSNIPKSKIVVIPNAIDAREFEKSIVPDSDVRPYPITFIGRLDPVKDVPTLIAAVGRLNQLVHLHIWGEGNNRSRIEEEIRRHDLTDVVTMHGAVEHPNKALAESGLLVLPSLAEGFGLVIIEAMAAGVPVIGTNVAGICDVIRPDQTGVLVEAGHPGEMAAAIRRIVEDRELRRRLIRAADDNVRQRFTWEIVLGEYRQLFRIQG